MKVLFNNENISVAYIQQVTCFPNGFISLHLKWEKITKKYNLLNLAIGHQLQLSHMKLFFVIAANTPNCFSRMFLKTFLELLVTINFCPSSLSIEYSQYP